MFYTHSLLLLSRLLLLMQTMHAIGQLAPYAKKPFFTLLVTQGARLCPIPAGNDCKPHKFLMQGQQKVADAVLLLPPYYFASVPDEGIENFILAVLQRTKLPSYLYNYSVHTGNLISVESYKKLS